MSPVEHSSDVVQPPPAANSVGRRVFLAGIWGLLGTFLGYSAGINYGVQVWPTLRANSPEAYSGRMFIIQTRAGCAGFVGLMAGALFGGLGCYTSRGKE